MSRLEELIAELCPDGVEYKRLNEVFEQFSGMTEVSNKWADEGNCEFIDYMNVYTNLKIDVAIIKLATIKKLNQNMLKKGDVLFTSASETPDECAIASEIEDDIKDGVFMDDHLFGLRVKNEYKERIAKGYLKYAFRTVLFRKQVFKVVRGVTRFYISKTDFMNLMIPVPPLPVQSEIVRILDNFTELTSELTSEITAELTARKKQYEYYRNCILSENSKYPQKTLGDICQFVRGPFGGSLKKECFTNQGYAVYEQQHAIYGDFTFRYYVDEDKFNQMKRFEVKSGDLIMSCSGTMGEVSIIPEDAPRGIINQALLKLTAKNGIDNKYLKYCFENSITSQLNDSARGGAIKNVASVSVLKEIKISLPPIKEQQRIVDILDRFDTLCNDISTGLPAEIEARKKQYEYYRDKLLTFKELS